MPVSRARVQTELEKVTADMAANRKEFEKLKARRAAWVRRGTQCMPKPATYRDMGAWCEISSSAIAQILEQPATPAVVGAQLDIAQSEGVQVNRGSRRRARSPS